MTNSDYFNWYWLHELGSVLLDSDDEAYLRTAINRFYFSAFCEARDYLIRNKIYHNKKLKDMLRSNSGNTHLATRTIYYNANEFDNKKIGYKISTTLKDLRDIRNTADYETKSKNFKNFAIDSKKDSLFIFNTLREL